MPRILAGELGSAPIPHLDCLGRNRRAGISVTGGMEKREAQRSVFLLAVTVRVTAARPLLRNGDAPVACHRYKPQMATPLT
jgi:hypothetical protein